MGEEGTTRQDFSWAQSDSPEMLEQRKPAPAPYNRPKMWRHRRRIGTRPGLGEPEASGVRLHRGFISPDLRISAS
jgi:hypothetical protein